MCMYPMIDFYAESVAGEIGESSVNHHIVTLERIFRAMTAYGVRLEEEAIPGLTGAALQRWMNGFKKDHKPATINNYVVTLNPFLRWAHTIYPDAISDFSGVLHTVKLPDPDTLPEEERPKEKYYSDEEIDRLLAIPKRDSAQKKRDRAIIALFVGSGLRAAELCSLNIGDIVGKPHGSVYVRRKGGAWKTVEVAEFVYDFLETYIETRMDREDMDAPLFMTSHGVRCSGVQLYRTMRSKQDAAGLSDGLQRGCHVYRHKCISDVEKVGGAAVARDQANHKSLVITNRYDHSTQEQRSFAVNNTGFARRYSAR